MRSRKWRAAPTISNDRRLREEVLAYLIAAKASSVADTVVQALTTEGDDRLLPSFIDYFATCTKQHVAATEALRDHNEKGKELLTAARKAAAKLSRHQLLKLESRKP